MSKNYITSQGDMWDSIAYSQLGSAKYTGELMKENPKHLETYIFSSGVTLVIPDVSRNEKADSLPPWKKVSK